jgi:hypothetical protein
MTPPVRRLGSFRCLAVVTAALLASLTWVPGSQAAVTTVGTPLPIHIVENFVIGCSDSCLYSNPSAPAGASDVSPVNGVIVRWRLYGVTVPGPLPGGLYSSPSYRLRILSPQDGATYLGAGSSTPVVSHSPTERSVETFPARLPIKAGQLIGIESENRESLMHFGYSSAVTSLFIEPSIADGETGTTNTGWENGFIFPFNADVLPPRRSPASPPPAVLRAEGTRSRSWAKTSLKCRASPSDRPA